VRQRNTREETGDAYWNDRCRTHRRTLAKHFVVAGREVALSNSRGTETLRDLVASLGHSARAMTAVDAACFGEVVVVWMPLGRYQDLPARRPRWQGRDRRQQTTIPGETGISPSWTPVRPPPASCSRLTWPVPGS
jgi:hypothetical protein